MQFIPVDTANSDHFTQITQGKKTILTRHNKEYEVGKWYKDTHTGSKLKIIDIKTGANILVEVVEKKYCRNIEELFNSGLASASFGKNFKNTHELTNEYEKNRSGYSELLNRDGIVIWKIRRLKD
jgi:hypothetical protein